MYHIHHKIPKHMGGSNNPSNLVRLTVKQHAQAHKKLYEEYGNRLDYIAYKCLSGQIGHEAARIAAIIEGIAKSSKSWSEEYRMKRKVADKNYWKSLTEEEKRERVSHLDKYQKMSPSEESKKKVSETLMGHEVSEKSRKKISVSVSKYMTEEHRAHLSKKKKEYNLKNPIIPLVCEYCGREGKPPGIYTHIKKCETQKSK